MNLSVQFELNKEIKTIHIKHNRLVENKALKYNLSLRGFEYLVERVFFTLFDVLNLSR